MRGEASPPQMLNAFSSPVPISPVAVAVPPPLPCSGGLQAESPTAAQTPTAAFIGAASATSRNDAHAKKVREQAAPAQMRLCTDPPCACDLQVHEFIDKQTMLNPDAPRLIFGRDTPNQPVKRFEEELNAAALPLLQADPWLIVFDGTKPKNGPLIAAARIAANASYTAKGGWSKPKGSRAQGEAGDVGSVARRLGLSAPGGSVKSQLETGGTLHPALPSPPTHPPSQYPSQRYDGARLRRCARDRDREATTHDHGFAQQLGGKPAHAAGAKQAGYP